MSIFSAKTARNIYIWFTDTKAGQITWNVIGLIISVLGLIISIIGCATPFAPIAIIGIVVSASGIIHSICSLIMAIFS